MFDTKEYVAIPGDLDEMAPGAALAVMLSSIEVDQLSGHDRVVVLRAHHKMASHYQAQVYADMASVAGWMEDQEEDDPYWAAQAAAAEIRVALRLTRRAADYELALALDLRDRLPRVLDSLVCGDIDVRRAKTITYGTAHLSAETAREVVDRVIEDAPRLTTGQLAARIRRLCIEADPDQATKRYQDAVEDRRVVTEATESGTAHLMGLDLPAASSSGGHQQDQPPGSEPQDLRRAPDHGPATSRRVVRRPLRPGPPPDRFGGFGRHLC